ncbi:hypothetical protein AB6735_24175 [Mucilaginibacter sp. RCC_168]|uniref:hypothetical protein n=1 Tax=Mucilaginibacter sp. RCC_168 TaxID=3239221 RepID=UPI0035262DC1
MSIKKILTENNGEQIADSMLMPARITPRQKAKADQELAAHRKKRQESMSSDDKLRYQLMQLKFKLENYIKKGHFEPTHHFGYYLDQYLRVTGRKKKEFAVDIQIHQTQLSNIIKNRREPNESLMIRLELHSRNMIPAIDWFKLHEMEKGYQIKTDRNLREREKQFVTHSLQEL